MTPSRKMTFAAATLVALMGGQAMAQGAPWQRDDPRDRAPQAMRSPAPVPMQHGPATYQDRGDAEHYDRSAPRHYDRDAAMHDNRRPAPYYDHGPSSYRERGYGPRRWDERPGPRFAPQQSAPAWQYRGGYVPGNYRAPRYVVNDWRARRLAPPPAGYQWLDTGGQFALAAIATGLIAQIVLSN